jgi:LmbE family N-acetylglucosaminyl deacetylase
MNKVLVVAPHPDDETLGCGGTILRHIAQGDAVAWLIITGMSEQKGFTTAQIAARADELHAVAALYQFTSVHNLGFPTTALDTISMAELVEQMGQVFQKEQPEIVYLPYQGDVHTDHRIVFDAAASCTKWFRYGSAKRILAYETLSETDFGLDTSHSGFRPNVFINITPYINTKLSIMKRYANEMGPFPFPRSEEAIRALAALRGAAAGCHAAEGFMLMKEISL